MAYALTDIALQIKGTLAFILGLGGMFTIAKGLLTGLFVLPKIGSNRPSVRADAERLRFRLFVCAILSLILLGIATWLYFGSAMASIDADALKKSHQLLTAPQQWATAGLVLVAMAMVVIESTVSVFKYRFELLAKIG